MALTNATDSKIEVIKLFNKTYVVAGCVNGHIELMDLKNWQAVASSHSRTVTCMLQIDERRLLSSSMDGTIKMWNIKDTSAPLNTLDDHEDSVRALIKIKDTLISASNDKTIKMWDLESLTCHTTLLDHSKWSCVCYTMMITPLLVVVQIKQSEFGTLIQRHV
jgi:WD40 repeat protein